MSVKLYDAPSNIDAKIAYLARVSSENQDNPNYTKLISYLIKEGHWSPFDMVNITLEIVTEKDVAIQILRHTGLKVQEWSQRYADCSDMKAPLRECRLQDSKNRQNSLQNHDVTLQCMWDELQREVQDLAFTNYSRALELGIAKELARSLLPIGLTKTKLYLNGSIRSWLFYCKARMHHSSQKEHRIIADTVWQILERVAPCTTEAFMQVYEVPRNLQ